MIERAEPKDTEAILALWNDVITQTTTTFTSVLKARDDIAALMASQPVFVARMDGLVTGFATYSQFRGGDGYRLTQEHAIYLDPCARGKGMGRRLFGAIEDHARNTGARSLIAGISGENAGGIAFHSAMGFGHVGKIPDAGHKFDRYLDLVLMQKHL